MSFASLMQQSEIERIALFIGILTLLVAIERYSQFDLNFLRFNVIITKSEIVTISKTENYISVLEIVILSLLALITLNRKKLSSNFEYRSIATKKVIIPISNAICSISTKNDIQTRCITDLTLELTISILGYLNSYEILPLTRLSKKHKKLLENEKIWEQLWIQTYGEIWHNINIMTIRKSRGIYWDPLCNCGHPQQGWLEFFLTFEVCWIDWLLAGYCTNDRCLIGIKNSLYDLTAFIGIHPGSPETLSEGAGCDATENFEEIGHSTHAIELLSKYLLCNLNTAQKTNNSQSDGGMQQHRSGAIDKEKTPLHRYVKKCQKLIANFALENLKKLRRKQLTYSINNESIMQQTNSDDDNNNNNNNNNENNKNVLDRRNFAREETLFSSKSLQSFWTEYKKTNNNKNFFSKNYFQVLPTLNGYYSTCDKQTDHFGHPKVFFDPLLHEWVVWWTCCGKAQSVDDKHFFSF
jgi:hypothetical protein